MQIFTTYLMISQTRKTRIYGIRSITTVSTFIHILYCKVHACWEIEMSDFHSPKWRREKHPVLWQFSQINRMLPTTVHSFLSFCVSCTYTYMYIQLSKKIIMQNDIACFPDNGKKQINCLCFALCTYVVSCCAPIFCISITSSAKWS